MAEQESARKDANYDIFVFVDPRTGEVETVMSFGPFGDSEYDPEARRWVALGEEDTWRVRDLTLRDFRYAIDWDNESDFDFDGKIITLNKFSDGSLDEKYLRKNTIFVNEPLAK
jgi:hypothetical protein